MDVVASILIFVAVVLTVFSYLKIERSTSGVNQTLRILRAEMASHRHDMDTAMQKIRTKMNTAEEKVENVVSRLDRCDKEVRSIANRLRALEEPKASEKGTEEQEENR